MRVQVLSLAGVLLLLSGAGCRAAEEQTAMAIPSPEKSGDAAMPFSPPTEAQMLPPLPVLSAEEATVEANRLRRSLHDAVPHLLVLPADAQATLLRLATEAGTGLGKMTLDRPQLVTVVDRNPQVQALMIVLARPDAPWEIIGGTHVSTGQGNRKLYYITPTGVFPHTADILDYRAEGTYNENHIRGLGLRGMRVWDFGWQRAQKGWRANGEQGQIRMEMHATDPAALEQRIGRPASEGCIRIPAALNKFMDRHGVLDADYQQQAVQDIRYRAILPRDAQPTKLAGNTLIVIDSSN